MNNDTAAKGVVGCGIVLVLVLLLTVMPFIGCDHVISEGYRDGEIQKFARKGMIWQSWEGDLAQNGFKVKKGMNAESNVFSFSVDDESIVEQIKALDPGTVVRLHYKRVLFNRAVDHSTGYRIVKVEVRK